MFLSDTIVRISKPELSVSDLCTFLLLRVIVLIWVESTVLSGELFVVRDGVRCVLCSVQCVERALC